MCYNLTVILFAQVVEWSITTDCKSVAFGLRGFKSLPAHQLKNRPKAVFKCAGRDLKDGTSAGERVG